MEHKNTNWYKVFNYYCGSTFNYRSGCHFAENIDFIKIDSDFELSDATPNYCNDIQCYGYSTIKNNEGKQMHPETLLAEITGD